MIQPAATAAQKYAQYAAERSEWLTQAYENAKITIPSLFPDASDAADLTTSKKYTQQPDQSFGARGVNSLTGKLLQALLPHHESIVRYSVGQRPVQEMKEAGVDPQQLHDFIQQVEKVLAEREEALLQELSRQGVRQKVFEVLRQLIVAGNVLLFQPPTGGLRFYRMNSYVVKRAPSGETLEIIIQEMLPKANLPERVRDLVPGHILNDEHTRTVKMYTRVWLDGPNMRAEQEVHGHIVPDSQGFWPKEKAPYQALRFIEVESEDWGRGFVEEYLGDLQSIDVLQRAITLGSAMGAKVVWLVRPNGSTKVRALMKAGTGDFVSGNPEEVTALRLDKYADMSVAKETLVMLKQDLGQAFLLNSSIQRDAERVTATEFEILTAELQSALGGVYSLLAEDMQLPLMRRTEAQMEREGRLPTLPEGSFDVTIVSGSDAISRAEDLRRFRSALADMEVAARIFPDLADWVNEERALNLIFTNNRINSNGLLFSREQVEQQRQARAQQALVERAAPNAVNALASASG